MKYYICIMILLMVSCKKEYSYNEGDKDDLIEMTFKSYSSSTRTSLQSDNSVFWDSGDEISILANSWGMKNYRFTTHDSGSYATFTGKAIWENIYYGLYPYKTLDDVYLEDNIITTSLPNIQSATTNSFDKKANIAVAKSDENRNMFFYNACALLKFDINIPNNDKITSVKFCSNNTSVKLSGDIRIEITDSLPNVSISDGHNYVILESNDGFKSGIEYYMVVSPAVLSRGFTLYFMCDDIIIGYKDTQKNAILKQGTILDLGTINYISKPAVPVDLGLSVRWASCNIGANSVEDFGNYYAWGEVAPKSEYTIDNYLYKEDDDVFLYLGDNISGSDYDVARKEWGNYWRIPTIGDCEELEGKCTFEWITFKGVYGKKVTGPNGNSIFLPACGFCKDSELYESNVYGYYWLGNSSESDINSKYAYDLYFYEDRISWRSMSGRYCGYSIRPVTYY